MRVVLCVLVVYSYVYALPASAAAGKTNTAAVTFPEFPPLPFRHYHHWLSRLFLKRQRQSPDAKQQLKGQPLARPTRVNVVPGEEQNSEVGEHDEDDEDNGDETTAAEQVQQRHQRQGQYSDVFIRSYAALSATVSAALKNLLADKRRLGRFTVSGIQVGLVLYLAHAVWKSLVEVMEEYSQEISGTGTEPPFVKPEQVDRVLSICEQQMQNMDGAGGDNNNNNVVNLAVPLPLLQLIHRLLASGLALRSTPQRPTSVESVLSQLTRSEASLLQQCLWTPPQNRPSSSYYDLEKIQTMWTEVAGLFPVKERLLSALASLQGRNKAQQAFGALFQHPGIITTATETTDDGAFSTISSSPNGILLYGPPGCGKTLLVRALATTARVPCLVVTPSTLLRKYVGETNSQVRNLFSLAQKLAPCILCIDELDGLFRERSDTEHEVSRDLKTEFLQWWDGMLSDPLSSSSSWMATTTTATRRHPILVIGASNRPFDVDSAVLRRLPQSHYVGLPDVATRSYILRQLLDKVPSTVDAHRVAILTDGYSPSDLRQLLQSAAVMGPMREASVSSSSSSRNSRGDGASSDSKDDSSQKIPPATRPLTTDDVLLALQHTPPTPMSHNYRMAMSNFAARTAPSSLFATSSRSIGTSTSISVERPGKWETDEGTFYHIGQLDVDPQAFDVLSDMISEISQNEDDSSDDDEETDLD